MAADLPDYTTGINITGSSINIPVNLVASSVTLNVNITAAAVTLNMIFTGQTVANFTGSQYGATLGNGIYMVGTALVGIAPATVATYTVPAGKTFYMQGLSYGIYGGTAFVTCSAQLFDAAAWLFDFTTVGGGSTTVDTPIPFATGHVVTLKVGQASNPQVNLTAHAGFWGWLG